MFRLRYLEGRIFISSVKRMVESALVVEPVAVSFLNEFARPLFIHFRLFNTVNSA